jgi:hypothetical protein
MTKHLIVGAGGIASWLVPLLKHTLQPEEEITIMDGDILESKNLDRQFFGPEWIGWNKAEALAEIYNTKWENYYLARDCYLLTQRPYFDVIWCCADNHPARKLCLELVEEGVGEWAIIGGNEYTDSEAYAYHIDWQGTAGDPLVYYPELSEDKSGDPLAPFACQGQAQKQNRQLALANYLAAGFMVHLWWFLTTSKDNVERLAWPVRHWSNFAVFNTKPYGII